MTHRFLLDGMLGSLARWLRIIGYDTLYYVDMDDDELRDEAKKTHRILVTRDTELYKIASKKGTDAIHVNSDKTIDQLKELADTLELKMAPMNTRCPRCNGVLESVEKNMVKDRVPEASFKAYNKFWVCTECDAVYWRGSHWVQIEETLNKIED